MFRLPTPTPAVLKNRLRLPTPTPAVLKNRLRLPTPTPAVLKTDSDSRLRLQLKTCDSTDSRLRLRLHNPGFKDISSLLRYAILKSSIYFNIGFKLNGKFFSTYDSL